jgi:hypothetical protein
MGADREYRVVLRAKSGVTLGRGEATKFVEQKAGIPGRAVLGQARLGAAPSCTWVALARLNLRRPAGAEEGTSYDRHFAGKPIMAPLVEAFAFLRRLAGS